MAATTPLEPTEAARLAAWLRDARARTLALVDDYAGERWLGPRLGIVNPPLWELGHVGWFQEWWCLRGAGARDSMVEGADQLYDSARVSHKLRWDLPLPSPEATRFYLDVTLRCAVERLASGRATETEAYFLTLAVFHEDMHAEALLYTRQTVGDPAPAGLEPPPEPPAAPPGVADAAGDVVVPGGRFLMGAVAGEAPFVFDNEKWAHEVEVAPFAIAKRALSEGEMEAFVEDGGYRRRELWSEAGWVWRMSEGAEGPAYWRKDGGRWWRRRYDAWVPVHPARAMVHLGWYEAEAWCRWAGRRMPTEAEWERAASFDASGGRRARPWGAGEPDAERCALGARACGPVGVDALPAGDSALGLRQLWGNVWEWTADAFGPYPGFVVDPYREYSAPWFGNHKVLRGGCFATQSRLLRTTWRNFYTPDRRDVWAGLRTCALRAP